MNPTAKLWLLRIASIPAALFIPLTATALVGVIAQELGFEDLMLYGSMFVAFVISTCVAISLSAVTVFASRAAPLAERGKLLRAMAIFDVLALVTSQLITLPGHPYERTALKFEAIHVPAIDVSGTWAGEWTDPMKKVTQAITLTLQQEGNNVAGTIADESGTKWRIIEGVVSGDRLNLFYDREMAWRSAGATLLGSLKDGRLTGFYYGHDRPKRGWAAKGPWHATKFQ